MRWLRQYRAQRLEQLQAQGIVPRAISTVEDILPVYFSDPSFEIPDELRNLHYNPAAEQLTWSALGEFDFTADVAQLDYAVLLLFGKDDPFGLTMAQATQASLLTADVGFVLLDKCGHFWHECPDEFFSRLRAFLDLPTTP